jgi:hypothetical protein
MRDGEAWIKQASLALLRRRPQANVHSVVQVLLPALSLD